MSHMTGDHFDDKESGSEKQDQVQLDGLQSSEPFFHSHDPAAKPYGERSYFIPYTAHVHIEEFHGSIYWYTVALLLSLIIREKLHFCAIMWYLNAKIRGIYI